MKSSKLLKKGDIVIIFSLVLLSLLWFAVSFFSAGEKYQARIYVDGSLYKTVEFSAVDKEEIITLDGCAVKVTKDGVCFLYSDCPDGLCVKRGLMTKSGDVMACVPEGVTVQIAGGRAVDGISY